MTQASHSPRSRPAEGPASAPDRSGAYWPSGMKKSTLDQSVWTFIYGGLLLVMVGLWARDVASGPGTVLAGLGGLFVLVGVVLVWVRSRRAEDAPSDGKSGLKADR